MGLERQRRGACAVSSELAFWDEKKDSLEAFDFSRDIGVSIFRGGVYTVQPGVLSNVFHASLRAIDYVF